MPVSKIFLSAVTDEFGSYREPFARRFKGPDLIAHIQEEFIPGTQGTLLKLDRYIRSSHLVVHLVGNMTGAPMHHTQQVRDLIAIYPKLLDRLPFLVELGDNDSLTKITYTQWEAYLAIYHKKDLVIASPTSEQSKPVRRDAMYQLNEAQAQAQSEHLDRLYSLGGLRSEMRFTDEESLSLAVWPVVFHLSKQLSSQPANAFSALAEGHPMTRSDFHPIATFALNRVKQRQALAHRLSKALGITGDREPLVFLVAGPEDECPDRFLDLIEWRLTGISRESSIAAEFNNSVAFAFRKGVLGVDGQATKLATQDIARCIVELCSNLGVPESIKYLDRLDDLSEAVANYLAAHKNFDIVLQSVHAHTLSWSAKDEAMLRGVLKWFATVRVPEGAPQLVVVVGISEVNPRRIWRLWDRQRVLEAALKKLAGRRMPGISLVTLDWLTNIVRLDLDAWRDEVLVDILPGSTVDIVRERDEIHRAAVSWHARQHRHPLKVVGENLAKLILDSDFRMQVASK